MIAEDHDILIKGRVTLFHPGHCLKCAMFFSYLASVSMQCLYKIYDIVCRECHFHKQLSPLKIILIAKSFMSNGCSSNLVWS